MLENVRLSALKPLVALVMLVLISACATPDDKTVGMTPEKIYSEAKDDMESGAYDKAIPLYEKLESRAAGTPLAQQAQLEKAYAQYKIAEPVEALATLDRFMKQHPASPALDYALYLKGIINFNDKLHLFGMTFGQDTAERDQKAARDSYESFKELIARFPNSRYAGDARVRLGYIVNNLARYEVSVARYYYTKGAYIAALNRAQLAVTDFRGVAAQEEALYLIMACHDAMGATQLRDDARRVLAKNFPNSPYLAPDYKPTSTAWWKLW